MDTAHPPTRRANPDKATGWGPRFYTIWAGQALSLLGSGLVQFALIWYLTESTGSATVLATASLAGLLPTVLLGPIAGVVVDRHSRKRVMIVADALIAAATLLLAALQSAGVLEVWHIYGLLAARAVGGAFHWPAMQASTPLLVPREELSRVAGLNNALHGAVGIAVPPLAALLLGALPLQWILAIDIVTALCAIAPLVVYSVPQPQIAVPDEGEAAVGRRRTAWEDVAGALRFLKGWPGILMLCIEGMLIRFLLVPAVALQPLFVLDHLGGEAQHLGWIRAGGGLGTVAGGLALARWGASKGRIRTGQIGLLLDGLAIMAFALAPPGWFAFSTAMVVISGAIEAIALGSQAAVAQAAIPIEIQGRVFGLVGGLGAAMGPIGLAIAGPTSNAIGPQFWFLVGGFVTLAMGAAGLVLRPVRDIDAHVDAPGKVESVSGA